MINMVKATMFAFLVWVSTTGQLWAGSSSGFVTNLLVVDDGRVIFEAGNHINKPDCSTETQQGSWVFGLGTNSGRAMYELLQTAIQQNLSVTVEGRSQCYFPYNAREQVYYLVINNS